MTTMEQTAHSPSPSPFGTFDDMSLYPAVYNAPPLTVSPLQTTLQHNEDDYDDDYDDYDHDHGHESSPDVGPTITVDPPEDDETATQKPGEKKPKKRKSWGQELPVPKTNLPPRLVSSLQICLLTGQHSTAYKDSGC